MDCSSCLNQRIAVVIVQRVVFSQGFYSGFMSEQNLWARGVKYIRWDYFQAIYYCLCSLEERKVPGFSAFLSQLLLSLCYWARISLVIAVKPLLQQLPRLQISVMGCCASRTKSNGTAETHLPYHSSAVDKSTNSHSSNQFQVTLPTKRHLEYWARRVDRICGKNSQTINKEQVAKLFSYLNLDKETESELYLIFRQPQEQLTRDRFFAKLRSVGTAGNTQLAQMVAQLYLRPGNDIDQVRDNFNKHLSKFLVQPQQNQKASSQNHIDAKIQQLQNVLKQQNLTGNNEVVHKWLKKSMNFKRFKHFFFEGGLIEDQKEAYKSFCIDTHLQLQGRPNMNTSEISKVNKQGVDELAIINQRWCFRMLLYMNERYTFLGLQVPNLKRHSTDFKHSIDYSSVVANHKKMPLRKQSLQGARASISRINAGARYSSIRNRKMSEESATLSELKNILILEKDLENYQTEIGQIDNHVMLGCFTWELKRNLRRNYDYLVIREETYDKLLLCFGGGPKLKRRVVQGYIQLRPFFVISYQYTYDQAAQKYSLENEQTHKFSSSVVVKDMLLSSRVNNMICYHKNIGTAWQVLRFEAEDLGDLKIGDVFSETSFIIWVHQDDQKTFQSKYLNRTSIAKLGDLYRSSSYKIHQAYDQSEKKLDFLQVCIVQERDLQTVRFCALNWNNHLQKTIPRQQFNKHFELIDKRQASYFPGRQKRAGFSNLGNTCYMNASLQAIMSCFKEEQIMKFKGELAEELKQITKSTKRSSKSVFPLNFKTKYDKYFDYFKGNDQHDAHQFCLCLFMHFDQANQHFLSRILQNEITQTTKCTKCSYKTTLRNNSYIIELPLSNNYRREVKIDYVTRNVNVRVVSFEIQENCSIRQWKKQFQRVSGAREYYLCEVEGSNIIRTFNSNDGVDQLPFSTVICENSSFIMAYELETYYSNLTIERSNDYICFREKNNHVLLAKVIGNAEKLRDEHERRRMTSSLSKSADLRNKVLIKCRVGKDLEEKLVPESQMLLFPECLEQKELIVKVINYDSYYSEKIGRPFLLKFASHLPYRCIRQALEQTIGTQGYNLRLSVLNEYSLCQICHRNCDQDRCFRQRENFSPIAWINGAVDVVAVWSNHTDYFKKITKTSNNNRSDRNLVAADVAKFDYFEQSISLAEKAQILSIQKCQQCLAQNIDIEHAESITSWPQILIVHLNRFKMIEGNIYKVHSKWKLEQHLPIKTAKTTVRFTLKAVICHIGASAFHGHYVTVAGGYKYNDELVTLTRYDEIEPQSIYMLFYAREDS